MSTIRDLRVDTRSIAVKLYVDLESLQLIEAVGFRNPVTSLRIKRGDYPKFEVLFLSGGSTAVSLGAKATLDLRFGAKSNGQFGGDYLVYNGAWEIPEDNDTSHVYSVYPCFNTVELDAALRIGTESELPEITLMGEITWRTDVGTDMSTRTFSIVVENDVVRGSEVEPQSAVTGFQTLYLPAARVSPNANTSHASGSVGANNAVTVAVGDDCDVVVLDVSNASTGYGAPAITVNPDGDLSTSNTTVKVVGLSGHLHNSFKVTGDFYNSENVQIDTSLIGRLTYAGLDGDHYWTDNGTLAGYTNYVFCNNPGASNAYWSVCGEDPNAGLWSYTNDGQAWPDGMDFTDCGTNGETGTPVVVSNGFMAQDLIDLVAGEEDLTGMLTCVANGASTGGVESFAVVLRHAAQAAFPGQPCIVGDSPGPFDQFLNTTFPDVWTQVLDRSVDALSDAGAVGMAVAKAGTKGEAFTALSGCTTVYEFTEPTSGFLALPDGAKAVSFVLVGGGGGGGSGRKGVSGAVRCGGGGGGAGNVVVCPPVPISRFSWPQMYLVGAGGTGGAAITSGTYDGNNGGTGNSSSFLSVYATGGAGGGGGTATAGVAGTTTGNTMLVHGQVTTAGAGAAASGTGGVGGTAPAVTMLLPTGGGSGGGITSTNVSANGGAGGRMGVAGVYSLVPQSQYTGYTDPLTLFGTGGWGGFPLSGATNGCAGGAAGGGGGGGGAGTGSIASGSGGHGGCGLVRITFHF